MLVNFTNKFKSLLRFSVYLCVFRFPCPLRGLFNVFADYIFVFTFDRGIMGAGLAAAAENWGTDCQSN